MEEESLVELRVLHTMQECISQRNQGLVDRKGEEKLDGRIKMLKLPDKGGWEAVDAYETDPVYDDDEDNKKWKRAVRQVKEDAESKRKKAAWRGQSGSGFRGGYGGYYGASRRGGFGG